MIKIKSFRPKIQNRSFPFREEGAPVVHPDRPERPRVGNRSEAELENAVAKLVGKWSEENRRGNSHPDADAPEKYHTVQNPNQNWNSKQSNQRKSERHTFTAQQPYREQFVGRGNDNREVIKIVALGGYANVTRNMYIYEYKDDIVIIDCGIGFPTEGMLGVDLVIPDITYLKDKLSKIRGIVITHGHEDHLGGLPYIWPQLGNVPIYSQRLTCGMIRSKFTEHKLPKDQIKELKIDSKIKLGVFDIDFYQVSHSIPDSTGIVLRTPIGTLIHQADFKIDWTPVNGQVPDVGKLAAVGSEGVLYMSIDCLRADKPGYTLSERSIEGTFESIEASTPGMMVITMTSSNITRVQQAINVAQRAGRKMVLAGRSVINNFEVARNLGYLDVPSGMVIPMEELKRYPHEKENFDFVFLV